MTGARHPGSDDAASRGQWTGSPGEVLAKDGSSATVTRDPLGEGAVLEDVRSEQRGRVSTSCLHEVRVDLEGAQVVRLADIVHGRDQRLLGLGLSRRRLT